MSTTPWAALGTTGIGGSRLAVRPNKEMKLTKPAQAMEASQLIPSVMRTLKREAGWRA
jgi:hypothetical protein